jgi:hypothetical protein
VDALGRRLMRLRRIQTELRNLCVDSAADAVGEEIASLERLPRVKASSSLPDGVV